MTPYKCLKPLIYLTGMCVLVACGGVASDDPAGVMCSTDEVRIPAKPTLKAVGLCDLFWKNGQVIKVFFLDGDPDLHKEVLEAAGEWCKYANIRFEHTKSRKSSHISITFSEGGMKACLGRERMILPGPEVAFFPVG